MRDPLLTGANVPVGNYAMAAHTGDLLFLASHGVFEGGRLITPAAWAKTITTEQAASERPMPRSPLGTGPVGHGYPRG